MWDKIKKQLILPYLDIKLLEYDLGIINRDKTNDKVTIEAGKAIKENKVKTINNTDVDVGCETICVHSDTPNAIEILKALRDALSNKKMSYVEIIAANSIILLALYLLERYWSRTAILSKIVTYEIIENIRPDNHHLLKADLEKRLGIEILSFEIGNVNFLRDVAKITVYYKL